MDAISKYHRNQYVLSGIFSFVAATLFLFEDKLLVSMEILLFLTLFTILFFVWIIWRNKPDRDNPRHEKLKKGGGMLGVGFLTLGYLFSTLIMLSKGPEFGSITGLMMPIGFYSMGLGVMAFGLGMISLDPSAE